MEKHAFKKNVQFEILKKTIKLESRRRETNVIHILEEIRGVKFRSRRHKALLGACFRILDSP